MALIGYSLTWQLISALSAQLSSWHDKNNRIWVPFWCLTAFQPHSSPPSDSHLDTLMISPDVHASGVSGRLEARVLLCVSGNGSSQPAPNHSSNPVLALPAILGVWGEGFSVLSRVSHCVSDRIPPHHFGVCVYGMVCLYAHTGRPRWDSARR